MTLDEKIRLGLLAVTAVSGALVALHLGSHIDIKIPFLEEIGGIGSF